MFVFDEQYFRYGDIEFRMKYNLSHEEPKAFSIE